jgi:hypothetical protein
VVISVVWVITPRVQASALQNIPREVDQFRGAAESSLAVWTGHVDEAVVGLVLEPDEPLEVLRGGLAAGGDPAQKDGGVSKPLTSVSSVALVSLRDNTQR